MLREYGVRRHEGEMRDDGGDDNSFPYTNLWVENGGQVASVPCEERGLRRRTFGKKTSP
jgi:hypothetical protein